MINQKIRDLNAKKGQRDKDETLHRLLAEARHRNGVQPRDFKVRNGSHREIIFPELLPSNGGQLIVH